MKIAKFDPRQMDPTVSPYVSHTTILVKLPLWPMSIERDTKRSLMIIIIRRCTDTKRGVFPPLALVSAYKTS